MIRNWRSRRPAFAPRSRRAAKSLPCPSRKATTGTSRKAPARTIVVPCGLPRHATRVAFRREWRIPVHDRRSDRRHNHAGHRPAVHRSLLRPAWSPDGKQFSFRTIIEISGRSMSREASRRRSIPIPIDDPVRSVRRHLVAGFALGRYSKNLDNHLRAIFVYSFAEESVSADGRSVRRDLAGVRRRTASTSTSSRARTTDQAWAGSR